MPRDIGNITYVCARRFPEGCLAGCEGPKGGYWLSSAVAQRSSPVAHTRGQVQRRLVRPTSGKLRRGSGNVLVALSRGLAGKSATSTKIAYSLGLTKWGDQVLGWASDGSWVGQIKAIDHLVTVEYLDDGILVCSKGDARPPTPEELFMSKWTGAYKNRETVGYFQQLMNDEYLHAERQSNGRRSIMWSTDEAPDAFLKMIGGMLPRPSEKEGAHWLTATDEGEAPTSELLANGTGREVNLRIVHAHFPGTTVVWRRPFRKLEDSRKPHAEGAFIYDKDYGIDQSQVIAAVTATGSPVVRHAVKTRPDLLETILDGAK
jgi:ribosomal protein L30/L7E